LKKKGAHMDGNQYAVKFIRDLKLERVPKAVVHQAKRCLLDLVGAGLAGAHVRGAGILLDFSSDQMKGRREATVIRGGRKRSSVAAALVNGFIVNALDIDDGYRKVKGHPGAAVFPAVLALSEKVSASGKAFLEALIVGYEIGIRAGEILHSHYGYYHGSGSWGAIASAAAGGKLLGLSEAEMKHALGIAEAFAPLVPEMRAVEYPSMAPKDGIPWGAMVGTSAALLARRGFTGIPSLLGDQKRNRDVFTLGKDFRILGIYFKPYPCCRWAHPALDGLLSIRKKAGLNHRKIESIIVRTFSEAASLFSGPPTTLENAEYSLSYPLAVAAVFGEFSPNYLAEPYFRNRDVLRMMRKIAIKTDRRFQGQFPARCLSEVEVRTKQGKVYRSEVLTVRGDVDSPLTDEELEEKFWNVTEGILREDQRRRFIRLVWHFEKHSVKDLIRFLR
jgi:2-methylcitrate dehydratase PrpD